jgi:hypothetical protein
VRAKVIMTAVLATLVATSAYAADTKSLRQICDSARLTNTDRKACRAEFKAATTDEARRAAFRAYDEKMNGLSTKK